MSVNTHNFYDDFTVITVVGKFIRVDRVFDCISINDAINRVLNEDDIDPVRKAIMEDKSLLNDYISEYLVGNPILVEGDGMFDRMYISVIN